MTEVRSVPPTTVASNGVGSAPLTLEALERAVANRSLDTVVLALVDMEGRLVGKRLTARHFLESAVTHGAESCEYLLATDVDMSPQQGYGLAGWNRGFGDFQLKPDLSSLRLAAWQQSAALVIADAYAENGDPISVSPRQILRRQLQRLAARGLAANVGTELEFMIFRGTYREAWDSGYRNLTKATPYSVDYALLDSTGIEPLVRRIRNSMEEAGLNVESSKGECNLGQHEINFRYGEAISACDNHSIYKFGAKEIAAQEGMAITFMAKFDQREGSSCHVHLSLADADGSNTFAGNQRLFDQFLAGQLACLREMTLLFAPQINSYKRYVPEMFAPTAVAWGHDNRTCALRVIGHGQGLHIENRLPGADVNPYLAVAAMIAAGLHGLDAELTLEPATVGSAYEGTHPHVPHTMRAARELFAAGEVARRAFGEDVVDHYVHRADIELAAYESAITDWERFRGFERL
ncbi:MAG TPA: glutamine synthetase family protein [Candidatus Dormibacteraeota bacterium]|nr:glutamine synthetase family protein [Candidatus Dormibacteraeota bacterium]